MRLQHGATGAPPPTITLSKSQSSNIAHMLILIPSSPHFSPAPGDGGGVRGGRTGSPSAVGDAAGVRGGRMGGGLEGESVAEGVVMSVEKIRLKERKKAKAENE